MSAEPDHYQTYLLRMWRVPRRGTWQWCASLESRHTGERQSFATVEELLAFLSERCSGCEEERDTPRHSAKSAERSSGVREVQQRRWRGVTEEVSVSCRERGDGDEPGVALDRENNQRSRK